MIFHPYVTFEVAKERHMTTGSGVQADAADAADAAEDGVATAVPARRTTAGRLGVRS